MQNKTKIIFLDIDGTLNSINYFKSLDGERMSPDDRLDPKAIVLLNNIIESTDAKIVVSSSWRIGKDINSLQDIFDSHQIHGTIIGLTPDNGLARGLQIQEWIDNSNLVIDSFIILDDDSDMCHLSNRLIKTSIRDGLTEDSVRAAIAMLAPIV